MDAAAEIAFLKLVIEKLQRELYGRRSERKRRLFDRLELQLDEVEASATEEVLEAETRRVEGFTRHNPARKPLPAHLPRERVAMPPPTSCACCGSDKLSHRTRRAPGSTESRWNDGANDQGNTRVCAYRPGTQYYAWNRQANFTRQTIA